jgi:hypothetical protein
MIEIECFKKFKFARKNEIQKRIILDLKNHIVHAKNNMNTYWLRNIDVQIIRILKELQSIFNIDSNIITQAHSHYPGKHIQHFSIPLSLFLLKFLYPLSKK